MILRNKGSQETYHVPRSVGEGLVAAGIAIEVQSQVAVKPVPTTSWVARDGVREGDFQHPPTVYYHCGTYGLRSHTECRKGQLTLQPLLGTAE